MRHWQLRDRDWLEARAGIPSTQIAAELGCSPSTVRRARRKLGVDRPGTGTPPTYPELRDPDWLKARESMSHRQVADELGCHPSVVGSARRKLGYPPRHRGRLSIPELRDRDWLEARAGMSSTQIAAELGCSPSVVRGARQKLAVDRPGVGAPATYPELRDPDWLKEREDMSHQQVADELGCSLSAVKVARRRFGYPSQGRGRPVIPELRDLDWLKARAELPARQVAAELGCNLSTVSHARKRLGLDLLSRGRPVIPELRDPDWLEARKGMTHQQVADELGCSTSAVRSARRNLDAPPPKDAHQVVDDS